MEKTLQNSGADTNDKVGQDEKRPEQQQFSFIASAPKDDANIQSQPQTNDSEPKTPRRYMSKKAKEEFILRSAYALPSIDSLNMARKSIKEGRKSGAYYDKDLAIKAFRIIIAGGTPTNVCRILKISISTFYKFKKVYREDFDRMVVEADEVSKSFDSAVAQKSNFSLHFVRRLKWFREVLGLSQDEFAKVIGLGQRDISWWERGTTQPNIYMIYRLNQIFGLNPNFLLIDDSYKVFTGNGITPYMQHKHWMDWGLIEQEASKPIKEPLMARAARAAYFAQQVKLADNYNLGDEANELLQTACTKTEQAYNLIAEANRIRTHLANKHGVKFIIDSPEAIDSMEKEIEIAYDERLNEAIKDPTKGKK